MAASRLIYRSLSRLIRDQSRKVDFRSSRWPVNPGIRGVAATSGAIVDLGDASSELLEWEDILQREDVRADPASFLKLFFLPVIGRHEMRDAVEKMYPCLFRKFSRMSPDDQGFAALRQASQYNEILNELDRNGLCKAPTDIRSHRPPSLLFAIGDVCEHRFFGKCVVVGWDGTCQQGERWVKENRVRQTLKYGTEQPFYNVRRIPTEHTRRSREVYHLRMWSDSDSI